VVMGFPQNTACTLARRAYPRKWDVGSEFMSAYTRTSNLGSYATNGDIEIIRGKCSVIKRPIELQNLAISIYLPLP